MSPALILSIGAVVVVFVLVYGPVRDKLDTDAVRAECNALRSRLAVLSTQGGSVDEQQRIEAQLDECVAQLRARGIEVDDVAEVLTAIARDRRQVRQEWSHFRSTDYADTIKRGNTRSTILRLGEDLAGRYVSALSLLSTDAETRYRQIQRLLREIRLDIQDSFERYNCYKTESAGCGRFLGSVEDDKTTKLRAEMERVSVPLKAARERLLAAARAARPPAPPTATATTETPDEVVES